MRIAHLADLHLGKVFHAMSLIEDQHHALHSVVDVLRREGVEALVLAGDLYDRALPGSEAVRLLDWFLREVNEGCEIPVVAIAGNHDSGDHLGFGSWLFSRGAVHVRGRVEQACVPITLESRDGEDVTFYPLPYVEPEAARGLLGLDGEVTHRTTVEALLAGVRAHMASQAIRRAVVVAHAFVQGGAWPDESRRSERSLFLGRLGAVPATVFEGFGYTALGHLHRPQDVTPDGSVRYSGSLLKYSFDEADHDKGLTLVDLPRSGAATVLHVSIYPRRDLCRLSGSLADLLERPEHSVHEGDFVSAELTDHPPPLQAMERLRRRFPHAAELRFRRPLIAAVETTVMDPGPGDPESVFAAFFAQYEGAAPTEAQREVFREALRAAASVAERGLPP